MPSRPKRSIRQVDLGAANTVHTHTESDITDLDHTDDNAIHDNVSGEIAAITAKTTPVDADVLLIEDSAATNAKKKLSWSNVKATLKTYFDALYAAVSHSHTEADITDLDHYTDTDANAAIDARVNKAFVDALNVDADTLDGEHASAFADAVHSHELDELDATAITDGHVLTAQGDGTAAWEAPVTGVTDHGALTGLEDDDHTQYLNTARHQTAHSSARWERSGVQSIPNNSSTAVVWNLPIFDNDTDNMWSMDTSTGRLTINTAGVYLITTSIAWEANLTGARTIFMSRTASGGGSASIASDRRTSAGVVDHSAFTVYSMGAGDTIDILVVQDSGGSLDVRDSGGRTNITITRIA